MLTSRVVCLCARIVFGCSARCLCAQSPRNVGVTFNGETDLAEPWPWVNGTRSPRRTGM